MTEHGEIYLDGRNNPILKAHNVKAVVTAIDPNNYGIQEKLDRGSIQKIHQTIKGALKQYRN